MKGWRCPMCLKESYIGEFEALLKKVDAVNDDISKLQNTNLVAGRETISHYDVLMQKKAALISFKAEVIEKYYEILADNEVAIEKKQRQLEKLEDLLRRYFGE